MKHRSKGTIFIMLGLAMIVSALCIVGYNIFTEKKAADLSYNVLEKLQTNIPDFQKDELNQYVSVNVQQDLPDYVLNPDMEMPTTNIDGWNYIGILEIPDIELSLPVITEWSYPALKVAPARYAGSAYTNDLIIAGHNYESHFGKLKELDVGSVITFTDVDGNVFVYEVAVIEILHPTAVEEMMSGEWDLSLFTCTVGGSYRVTVRCVIVC